MKSRSLIVIFILFQTQQISAQNTQTQSTEEKSCTRLKLEVLDPEKFTYFCNFPSKEGQVENCGGQSTVESGTRAYFRCRPPLKTRRGGDGELNSWLCQEGKWHRSPGRPVRLVCYQVPPSRDPTNSTLPLPIMFDPRPAQIDPTTTTAVGPVTIIPTLTLSPNPIEELSGSTSHVKCPPLTKRSMGVLIECVSKFSGVTVTSRCDRSVPVGTEAKYYCDEYYEINSDLSSYFRSCQDDGTWTGSSEKFFCAVRCGHSNTPKKPLITNGVTAVRGQWPWAGALFIQGSISCGATLISLTTVLTAGHCVAYSSSNVVRNVTDFRIEFGKDGLTDADEFVQIRKVSQIILNPSYSVHGYDSDIALMVLTEPVKLSYYVQPICFPQKADSTEENFHLAEHSLGTVAGFGKDAHGNVPDHLQVTVLPVVSRRKCEQAVQDELDTSVQTRSTTYCAGFANGTNVCNGDSGSGMYFPLRVEGRTNKWFIQGIVSIGFPGADGNCDPTRFSFFTRVGSYANWIIRTLSLEVRRDFKTTPSFLN